MNHMVRNCKDFDPARFKAGYTSPKYDGVRAYYYPGEALLASRQNKPIYGMEHILAAIGEFPYPLDIELYIPGMEFNTLSGLVRDHQSHPEIWAYIIDVPSPGDLRTRLLRRADLVQAPFDPTGVGGAVNTPAPLRNVPHYRVDTLEQFWALHKQFLANGDEGSVWKSLEHQYIHKRDWHWMREVPIHSEDCVILDGYPGQGKMEGILGGFVIDFKGLRCNVGTMKNVTYEDRLEMWLNLDSYIGLVIEVQYKNLQLSGRPRQPRMKGVRYDKS